MHRKRWIVVGGGVGGMAGAASLARKGHDVVLIEAAPELGHASNGFHWEGFCLDYGCHLFGNEDREATDLILELLERRARPLNSATAVHHHGAVRENTELPDLRPLGEPALHELIRASLERTPAPDRQDLGTWLSARYGAAVARGLSQVCQKVFRIDPSALDTAARHAGPFRRVTIVDDALARALKQIPALDDRIATRSERAGSEFYPDAHPDVPARSFYPAEGGMRGFSQSGQRVLETLGVDLRLGRVPLELELSAERVCITTDQGERLEADELLWCNGIAALESLAVGSKQLEDRIHRVPLVLYYFPLPSEQAGPYTYVHCFDAESALFRASLPGDYAPGCSPAGQSYLCCEVPTEIGSELWEDPQRFGARVFEEARATGIVQGDPPSAFLAKPLRSSYKLPKLGYEALADQLRQDLAAARIRLPREWQFTSSASVRSVLASLDSER